MSNAPYLLPKAPLRLPFGDGELVDAMTSRRPPRTLDGKLMDEQAAAPSAELGLTREQLDAWALRSHQRAIAAIDAGRMAEEIVPVEVPGRRGDTVVDTDEAPRRDTSLERLAALPPLFTKHGATTAGNAPGVNDGAATLVLASEDWARERGLEPLARSARPAVRRRRLRLPRAHARRRRPRVALGEGRPHGLRHRRDRDQRGVRSVALHSSTCSASTPSA